VVAEIELDARALEFPRGLSLLAMNLWLTNFWDGHISSYPHIGRYENMGEGSI